ncbi:MAG: hypothetical protein E7391_04670 [Ruminococcaceae bacterium]|nr:hypothetical protein [Oscillospiraceae bacterium]
MSYSLKSVKSWYRFIRNKVGFLDVYDIAILITGMLSLGILIGTFFSKTIKKFASIFAFIGAIGSVFIFIKVFLKDTVL